MELEPEKEQLSPGKTGRIERVYTFIKEADVLQSVAEELVSDVPGAKVVQKIVAKGHNKLLDRVERLECEQQQRDALREIVRMTKQYSKVPKKREALRNLKREMEAEGGPRSLNWFQQKKEDEQFLQSVETKSFMELKEGDKAFVIKDKGEHLKVQVEKWRDDQMGIKKITSGGADGCGWVNRKDVETVRPARELDSDVDGQMCFKMAPEPAPESESGLASKLCDEARPISGWRSLARHIRTVRVWSHQAVHGDTVLEVCTDEIPQEKITVRNIQDESELVTVKQHFVVNVERGEGIALDAYVRSSFVETRPHALEFVKEPATLSIALDRAYESADNLAVMHKAGPDAEWVVLPDRLVLSDGGKRANMHVWSFCTRVVVEHPRIQRPQNNTHEAALLRPLRVNKPARPPSVEPDEGGDAFLTAFAPPEVIPDANDFVVEIVVFSLEYTEQVKESAASHGKIDVGARSIVINKNASVLIRLEVPSDSFEAEDTAETFTWNGHCGKVQFHMACLRGAESRRHLCKAYVEVDEMQTAVLRFELNVVPRDMPSPPVTPPSELTELRTSTTTLLPPLQPGAEHHIFINYRRTHHELADRVRRQLETYGYRCFFDLDPDCGLGVGDFQPQLENSLRGVPILIAILTPAPSGPDELRQQLSYTETVRQYAQEGWTDYCHVELKHALADPDTEVIPLFHPDYRESDYTDQLRDLPEDISGLAGKNARPIGVPALFDKSIEVVHELIQRHVRNQQSRAPSVLTRQLSDSLLRISSRSRKGAQLQAEPEPEPEPAPVPEPQRQLPRGWERSELPDGTVFYFQTANPKEVSFEPPLLASSTSANHVTPRILETSLPAPMVVHQPYLTQHHGQGAWSPTFSNYQYASETLGSPSSQFSLEMRKHREMYDDGTLSKREFSALKRHTMELWSTSFGSHQHASDTFGLASSQFSLQMRESRFSLQMKEYCEMHNDGILSRMEFSALKHHAVELELGMTVDWPQSDC